MDIRRMYSVIVMNLKYLVRSADLHYVRIKSGAIAARDFF